jgi:hypothetical protein
VAQLYPDEHAQALAELRSCSWHVPEHTVAQLIGFDGDVQNLDAASTVSNSNFGRNGRISAEKNSAPPKPASDSGSARSS